MMKNGHPIMKNNEKMIRKIGAFFYELRVTRSDVVNLSLSRRNAASVGDVLSRRPATR